MGKFKLELLFVSLILIYILSCQKETSQQPETKSIEINGDLSFGSVKVNEATTKVFTIENTGTGDIRVNSIFCPEGFAVDWSGGVIKKGESKQVNVKFSPTEAKSYVGEISIKSDAGSSPNSIQVSGTGQIDKAVLSIDPTSLDFEDVTINESKTMVITIKNTGKATLTISDITTPNTAFILSYNKSVEAGSSQQITVKFSPTAAQTYSGRITIKTNVGNAEVSVAGKGITAPKAVISVSPTSLDFGSVTVGNYKTEVFTITNKGNATLTINNITLPNSAYSFNYATNISAGSSQQITVKFLPAAAQTYSGKITIKSNGGDADVSVIGNGATAPKAVISVSPTSLDFGSVTVGNYKTEVFTITNKGNATLTINNITLPNSAYSFNYATNISAGSSQQITVKFLPAAAQTYSGKITIKSNGGDADVSVTGNGTSAPKAAISVSPASLDFGSVTVGNYRTEVFTITNTGNATLTINNIILPSSVFTGSDYNKDIPAGSSQQITIKFIPASVQSYSGAISISSNAGNVSISITGTGILTSKPVINTQNLDFGGVSIGDYSTQNITMTSTGDGDLIINSITSNNSVFNVSYNSSDLLPGSSEQIAIKFTPVAIAGYNGIIFINTNAGIFQIPVTGYGIGVPRISVSPMTLDFGMVLTGTKAYKSFRITNTGTAPLNILFVNPSYSLTPYFVPSLDYSPIPVGGYRDVTIEFTCYYAKSYEGYFKITSNAGPDVTIPVAALGVTSFCNPTATPTIGYYPTACDANNGAWGTIDVPQTGIIEAGINEINCTNHTITISFKRCDGKGFLHEGVAYVVTSADATSTPYNSVNFNQGDAYQNIIITDNNMAGTKTYYIKTWQDPTKYPEVHGGYAISNKITVTY